MPPVGAPGFDGGGTNVASVSPSDTTYTSGSHAFGGFANNGLVFFDNLDVV